MTDVNVLGIDLYQISTLLTHVSHGVPIHSDAAMSFFFRRLPPHRKYIVFAGLRSIIEYCHQLQFTSQNLQTLKRHPMLGPILSTDSGRMVANALENLRGFRGEIYALPEGTLAFAGPAYLQNGSLAQIQGTQIYAYTPLVQVKTELLLAKLIETPFVSRINFLSMVASKASRIVNAACVDGKSRPVIEFGQRRTHYAAAIDASYAAYLAGCQATSNVAATEKHGIPSTGTMDHFAIQFSEKEGIFPAETEGEFFSQFYHLFPQASTMLVDTYDLVRGITTAVHRTQGGLTGIRLDTAVTEEMVKTARALLHSLGADHTKILVSDRLNEQSVETLALAGADAFGVGENITCSPDAATGIGAVGKLVMTSQGKPTMKFAGGSAKMTLPGMIQAYRFQNYDLLTLFDEPAPTGGRPLLKPIWQGGQLQEPLPSLEESRAYVQQQIREAPSWLKSIKEPDPRDPQPFRMVISDKLHETIATQMEKTAADP